MEKLTLTEERKGEIAMIAYLEKKRVDGIILKPKEIKRNLINEAKKAEAKKAGISTAEIALFTKIVIETIYKESMSEIDSLIVDLKDLK